MDTRISNIECSVDVLPDDVVLSETLRILFGPPTAVSALIKRFPKRGQELIELQRSKFLRSESHWTIQVRLKAIEKLLTDSSKKLSNKNLLLDGMLQELTGDAIKLPDLKISTLHFPGAPRDIVTFVDLKPVKSQSGTSLMQLMTEDVLGRLETLLKEAAQVQWVSVSISRNIAKLQYPFELTDELWEFGIKKLRRVYSAGEWGELAPQQKQMLQNKLQRSLRARGEGVTDAEMEGLLEMVTEHLWHPALTEISNLLKDSHEASTETSKSYQAKSGSPEQAMASAYESALKKSLQSTDK